MPTVALDRGPLYQNRSDFVGTTAGDNYWYGLLQQLEAGDGGNVIAARETSPAP